MVTPTSLQGTAPGESRADGGSDQRAADTTGVERGSVSFPVPTGYEAKPERSNGTLASVGRWLMENPSARPTVADDGYSHHFDDTSEKHAHATHPWWQVMCLTGVDYFSTLAYQPSIAFLAAGALAPVATGILILVTLFGALPIYRRVAADSPEGEGSIRMLRGLLPGWRGKAFVLILIGFAATDFIITITLSAADATAHVLENALAPDFLHHYRVEVTLGLVLALGAVFMKGFKEAVGLAVGLVVAFLGLNAIVIGVSVQRMVANPSVFTDWQINLLQTFTNPAQMVIAAALVFPKLALGLSGFETGVAVMGHVRGDPNDMPNRPIGRIRKTKWLLTTAALTMSAFLVGSSIVTTTLIPAAEFAQGGKANGRALAYLAYEFFGNGFGIAYDIVTIAILWFAGASAMAGLLNLIPNYLPKYGMAPDFIAAPRPLVIVLTAIAVAVTIIFKADVDAQGGAYATGVLALIGSASLAATLACWREGRGLQTAAFGVVTVVFAYTLISNIRARPDGLEIASLFIITILVTSIVSRVIRSTELRADRIIADDEALAIVRKAASSGSLRIVCNRPEGEDATGYLVKEVEERAIHSIAPTDPIIFLEVYVADSSEFRSELVVTGHVVSQANILRVTATTIPNSIAAIMLWLRDHTGIVPHAYMEWTEGGPFLHAAQFLMFGKGETAPIAREILRAHVKDRTRRPFVHVG